MRLQRLWREEEAVSPVIGVILMVAITVILAAVIATFVLGLGEQVSQTAPQASFTFDYSEGASDDSDDSWSRDNGSGNYDGLLTITHAGGATLKSQNLAVTGTDLTDEIWSDSDIYSPGSEIRAGDSVEVWVSSDVTVRVTWTSETGTDSAVLRQWEGPDA